MKVITSTYTPTLNTCTHSKGVTFWVSGKGPAFARIPASEAGTYTVKGKRVVKVS